MILKLATKNTSVPALFLTRGSEAISVENKINIILSPSFYWYKAETLPVKKASAAKELAPSLFDGIVDEANYSYMAIKKEELFWLFAYDDLLIAQTLLDMGIKPSHINAIYFAQTECLGTLEAIKVNESTALISKDDAVSLIPIEYAGDTISSEHYFSEHTLSKEKVNVNFFQNSFLDEKYIYRLMLIATFVTGIYLAEYLLLQNDLEREQFKAYTLAEKYKLPATSFEIKSLKNGLESKQKRQIKLREDISALMRIALKEGEYMQKIIIKAKTAHLEIHLSDPKHAEAIKRYVAKTMKITKAKVVDNLFLLGVKYE